MTDIWYRVTLPYACFAIVLRGDLIVDAAPIARWAVGKEARTFGKWVKGKGGTIEKLREENRQNA